MRLMREKRGRGWGCLVERGKRESDLEGRKEGRGGLGPDSSLIMTMFIINCLVKFYIEIFKILKLKLQT